MSKKKPEKENRYPKAVTFICEDEKERDKIMAQMIAHPSVQAAGTIKAYNHEDDAVNINALIAELGAQTQAIHDGDLKRSESILIAQAHTLDMLFGNIMRRTVGDMALEKFRIYFTLALKAQSQCRATLEALAEIKNPRPYIQNNRADYQQVNNGGQPQPKPHAHAEENSKSTNGLLEDKRDETEWLDTGAPETAGRNDKELETVGAQHGAKN